MEKEPSDKDEDVYAPLITSSSINFEDLPQSEFYHFLLKCTDGLFKGKFFYINTSSEGEIIGGGDYNSLTLHIEKAGLEDKHCSIKFTNDFKYILKNLSSESGTWVKIFDLNLSQESRERVYRVSDYEFVILNSDEASITQNAQGQNIKPLKMLLRKRGDKTHAKNIDLNGEKLVFGSSPR